MKNLEILKTASRVVEGIIFEKTPPIFETCHRAYKSLGELVAYVANTREAVAPGFSVGINEVIKQLEVFRGTHAAGPPVEKTMKDVELAAYVKDQVEKALAEEPARALTRLHSLKAALAKATNSFSGGDTVTIDAYTDPWQQATLQVDSDGKKVTSGTAQAAEVTVPGINVEDIMKSMVINVEKSLRAAAELNTGWALDLNTPQFLRGARGADFGRDGTK
jgi:hypothetical protein